MASREPARSPYSLSRAALAAALRRERLVRSAAASRSSRALAARATEAWWAESAGASPAESAASPGAGAAAGSCNGESATGGIVSSAGLRVMPLGPEFEQLNKSPAKRRRAGFYRPTVTPRTKSFARASVADDRVGYSCPALHRCWPLYAGDRGRAPHPPGPGAAILPPSLGPACR